MKLFYRLFVLLVSLAIMVSATSCKTMVLNAVSDGLSSSDKEGVPIKAKEGAPDPMMAFMGEEDPVIVQEVLPVILKLYEIMHIENPEHSGNRIMLGTLNVMYANLCVESKAELMTDPRLLDEQVAEFERAKLHYMRGHDLIFGAFEKRWPGFTSSIMGSDENKIKEFVSKLTKDDVNSMYWACAGFFASFALNPLDLDIIGAIKGHIAVLEKVASLDPEYSNGAIWDVLTQIYVAAPMDFGGDYERGLYCHEQALKASKGNSAGIYVTKAKSICVPAGDKEGFLQAINAALAIDVKADRSQSLMNVLNQNKAKRLLAQINDYFIEW
jgi:predicted anti-sigma-YlaC factor YlaD